MRFVRWITVGVCLAAVTAGTAGAQKLSDPDEPQAVLAAERLGKTRSPQGLDALLGELALGLPPRVAAAALDAVTLYRDRAALDVLARYARHRNPELRSRAVYAVGVSAGADKRSRDALVAAVHGGLRDPDPTVRAAAARSVAERRDAAAAKPLIALLKQGDELAVAPLAAIATPDLARQVGGLHGSAPDAIVARCLGAILLRKDLGSEQAYTEIVKVLGRIASEEAIVALTGFLGAVPDSSPRPSRKEAQLIYDARLAGGGK